MNLDVLYGLKIWGVLNLCSSFLSVVKN